MSTCQTVRNKFSKKHLRHLQRQHAPEPETCTDEGTELPVATDDCTTETVQEETMTSDNITSQTEKDVQAVMPVQAEQAVPADSRADAGMCLELDFNALDNMAMNFLEGAEAEFTYHQAELIRLAYLGLNTENAIQAAQFVLDRARNLAPSRPKAREIGDPFNMYISDFVEQASGHLSYVEAEIIRRAARGCDSESIDELQYLLNRALKALHEHTAYASRPMA